MKEQVHEDPKIIAAAERRMHEWVMAEQIENRAVQQRNDALPAEHDLEFVTISREAGAGEPGRERRGADQGEPRHVDVGEHGRRHQDQ